MIYFNWTPSFIHHGFATKQHKFNNPIILLKFPFSLLSPSLYKFHSNIHSLRSSHTYVFSILRREVISNNSMAPAKCSVFLCLSFLCIVLLCSKPVLAQTKPVFACDVSNNPGLKNFSFCDPSLDVKSRVDDLVSKLTLQEKIGWLVNAATGISRLGIPNYEWWSEALHGVSYLGPGTRFSGPVPGATSFPQVILTGATFNESLFQAIGKVIYPLFFIYPMFFYFTCVCVCVWIHSDQIV